MGTEDNARTGLRRGLVLVMLAAMTWGTVGVTTKTLYGLVATTPLSVGFFRLALAVPALWFGCWCTLGRGKWQVPGRDLAMMTLLGIMTALYQVCYFAAIARIGVAVATLITLCTAPVMVAAMSVRLTGERLTMPVRLALGCALAGTAMLITGQPAGGTHDATVDGAVLALGSALGYAIVMLVSRVLAGRYHPLQPVAIGFSVGAGLLLLCAFATGLVVHYPLMGWALLGYLGVVPTAVAYGLFFVGLRYTPATTASVATLLEPLTSAVLAWWLCSERLSVWGGLGMLVLCSAMVLLYGNSARQ
jgi:drug/metabolite transporter, DME family